LVAGIHYLNKGKRTAECVQVNKVSKARFQLPQFTTVTDGLPVSITSTPTCP